jgi:hypothetical protein
MPVILTTQEVIRRIKDQGAKKLERPDLNKPGMVALTCHFTGRIYVRTGEAKMQDLPYMKKKD